MPTWTSPLHRRFAGRLATALDAWARGAPGRGEVGTDDVVAVGDLAGHLVDVAWYPPGRRSPALVVHVRSPVAAAEDVARLVDDLAHHGVSELWLADLEEPAVAQHRRTAPAGPALDQVVTRGPGDQLTSPLLPGFAVPLASLLRR